MYKKFLIVASKKDKAGINITTQLSQFKKNPLASILQNDERGFDFYLVDDEIVYTKNLDLNRINKYDFIILDSSPSMNEEMLSTILASDNLFVVTTPDYPTLSCTLKAAKLAKQRGRPISGLIINKIRSPRYELSLKEIEETTGIPVIARIPDDKTAIKACFSRMPITLYKKSSPFSREISNISSALTKQKAQKPIFHRLFSVPLRKEEVNRQALRKSFYSSPIRNN